MFNEKSWLAQCEICLQKYVPNQPPLGWSTLSAAGRKQLLRASILGEASVLPLQKYPDVHLCGKLLRSLELTGSRFSGGWWVKLSLPLFPSPTESFGISWRKVLTAECTVAPSVDLFVGLLFSFFLSV